MAAIPSFSPPNMNHLLADDSMDLAPSPAMATEDYDFELDPMREASAEPNQDIMIEDDPEHHVPSLETMQSEHEEGLPDDDMVDEDIQVQDLQATSDNIEIDPHQNDQVEVDGDEDILYEDDEEVQHDTLEDQQPHDLEIENEDDLLHDTGAIQELKDEETSPAEDEGENIDEEDLFQGEVIDANQNIERTQKDHEKRSHEPSAKSNFDASNVALEQLPAPDQSAPPETVGMAVTVTKQAEDLRETDATSQAPLPQPTNNEKTVPEDVHSSTNLIASTNDGPVAVDPDEEETQLLNNNDPARETVENTSQLQDTERSHDGPEKQPIAAIHTVKVNYQENEICLFPPAEGDNSETFFLPDVALAYESLDTLLKACREILSGTIGDDDELVLDIASLGLHISEGSLYASQITFSQVLDVYLALCHNDQIDHIDPLYCTLTSRVSLASQYAYLVNAAQNQKTFAEISLEHLGSIDGSGDEFEGDVAFETEFQESSAEVLHNEGTETLHENDPEDVDESRTNIEGHLQADNFVSTSSDHGDEAEDLFENPELENGTHESQVDEENTDANAEYDTFEDPGRSPTSTVRGDENGPEGEYDPLLDICLKPEICFCLSCYANLNEDINLNVGLNSEQLLNDSLSADATEQDLNHGSVPWEEAEGTIETTTANMETESSRTLEPDTESYSQSKNAKFVEEHTEEMTHDELRDHHVDNIGEVAADSGFEDEHTYDQNSGSAEEEPYSPQYRESDAEDDEDAPHESAEGEEDDLLDFDREDNDHDSREAGPGVGVSNGNTSYGHGTDFDGKSPDNDVTTQENTLLSDVNEKHAAEIQSSISMKEDEQAVVPAATPPATPAGPKSVKRKIIEDEDDFGLLDPATPENKRRRPS